LVQTYDFFFRAVLLFFIIEHRSRRVVQVGVIRTPNRRLGSAAGAGSHPVWGRSTLPHLR
jgi:hypothetical protein